MYCNISEAWGTNNIINNNTNVVEHFEEKKYTCEDYLKHIVDCSECQTKLNEKFNKIQERPLINLDNFDCKTKETIIIFILGLILLMTLNIFLD